MNYRIEIDGQRPLAVRKADLVVAFGEWPKAVDRMLHASRHSSDVWFEIVGNKAGTPGEETRVSTASAERAFERLCQGDKPPLMPSEIKRGKKSQNPTISPENVSPASPEAAKYAGLLENLPTRAKRVSIDEKENLVTIVEENGVYRSIRATRDRSGNLVPRKMISFIPSTGLQTPIP